MHQNWGKLLFMHWAIDPEILRALIPKQLSIDTFNGQAWIGVVPFTMWGIRASFLPAIPGTSAFHELNVRTYVHYQGVPGVWFFSLDAANALAVWGARTFYYLPYFNAQMELEQSKNQIVYGSDRVDGRGAPASFHGTWEIMETLPRSQPGSIQFFSLNGIACTLRIAIEFIVRASFIRRGRCKARNSSRTSRPWSQRSGCQSRTTSRCCIMLSRLRWIFGR